MDKASRVLAQGVPPGVSKSYLALADHGGVLRSTLHYRAYRRRSIEEKAQSQQYLTPSEEISSQLHDIENSSMTFAEL